MTDEFVGRSILSPSVFFSGTEVAARAASSRFPQGVYGA